MRTLFATLFVFSGCLSLACAAEVTLVENQHSVKALIGDDVFAVFQFDDNRKKPFVLPVTAPGGFELLKNAKPSDQAGVAGRQVVIAQENPHLRGKKRSSLSVGDVVAAGKIEGDWVELPTWDGWIHRRDIAPLVSTVTRLVNDDPPKIKDRMNPLYYDHPHHKGVWLSVDEVNGIKFWNEDGIIKNKSVKVVNETGNPAVLKTVNHWLDGKGKPLLKEATTISVYANRLMTYNVTFSARSEEVEIGDTKEGMFCNSTSQ